MCVYRTNHQDHTPLKSGDGRSDGRGDLTEQEKTCKTCDLESKQHTDNPPGHGILPTHLDERWGYLSARPPFCPTMRVLL